MKDKKAGRILFALVGVITLGILAVSFTPVWGADQEKAQGIVDKARATLSDFMADRKYVWLHDQLKEAKGVLIFPQVVKGGFFIGGSGGTGVLLVRRAANDWSDPAFYTLGSVTFGLQIGGEAAEVVMLAMNQKGIDSLLTSSVKLGGDVSVAIGPVGGGAKGGIAIPTVTADFISFARSKGLYAGLNLEGAVLAVRDSLNNNYYGRYYGRSVKPADIVIKKAVNPGAKELRAAVRKAAQKKR